ncbi:pyridoxine 5'-phosphate synthase [Candidatus Kinetoplastibacterium sorsogonicusi]|uniref:pyridoxine 5'-phosphate synthase n=1 Tax=Candidatus Kinetoplastidibacterium kentomonadis TaxID=1576550 RepID=UPI000D3E4888|nr:pyridoxine 5'-phosphate synthase [Candidatus Kinetoplastibacterium sorsogonicusi]
MIKLGVNIDHIATIRQQRRGKYPDLLDAALICKNAGADIITLHLREDRRHIQDHDVFGIKSNMINTDINMECAVVSEILDIACKVKPYSVCLVPERREELTTEGGLNITKDYNKIYKAIKNLKDYNIQVSLFIDPEYEQIEAAFHAGADAIELHTGKYANLTLNYDINEELNRINNAVISAIKFGLKVNAGHGLDYSNISKIASIKGISELNIGFSIISKAIFSGLYEAVKDMKSLIHKSSLNSLY